MMEGAAGEMKPKPKEVTRMPRTEMSSVEP